MPIKFTKMPARYVAKLPGKGKDTPPVFVFASTEFRLIEALRARGQNDKLESVECSKFLSST